MGNDVAVRMSVFRGRDWRVFKGFMGTLLRNEATATEELGNIQKECCGFVQLSSYVTPGKPLKTPCKGFHPFKSL